MFKISEERFKELKSGFDEVYVLAQERNPMMTKVKSHGANTKIYNLAQLGEYYGSISKRVDNSGYTTYFASLQSN